MIKTLLLGFNIFLASFVFAQTNFSGKVLEASSNSPLPYVNIGIIGKNIGTTSNGEGLFELILPKENAKDSLRFSMIGYQSKTILVADVLESELKETIIFLNEKAMNLSTATVKAGRFTKEKVLGNKSKSKRMVGAFTPVKGYEVVQKIKIKKSPTAIKSFNTYLSSRKLDSLMIRLNIYEVKDGKPGESLLNENIFISNKDITGRLLSIDLSKYNIYVEDDFFIGFECVDYFGKNELGFCASFIGPRLHEKETSQGDWNKINIVSLGFNVNVKY